MSEYRRLGEIMVERGILTPSQLEETLELRSNSNARFGELVVQLGFASEYEVATCLAEQYDLRIVNPEVLHIQARAVSLVPAVFALRRSVLAYEISANELTCAVADPIDISTQDILARSTGKRIKIVLAPESALQAAIAHAYSLPQSVVHAPVAKPPRRKKIDPQTDRATLLEELQSRTGRRAS
jgi:type IV pilus assembly protein PilB